MILDYFDVLILKKKLIHFPVKIILKSNCYQPSTFSNILYGLIYFCVSKELLK